MSFWSATHSLSNVCAIGCKQPSFTNPQSTNDNRLNRAHRANPTVWPFEWSFADGAAWFKGANRISRSSRQLCSSTPTPVVSSMSADVIQGDGSGGGCFDLKLGASPRKASA